MKKGSLKIEQDSEKSEDENNIAKLKQLPSWMQGKPIMGRVTKLSGWGWSSHNRLLRLTQHSLSYYSKVPIDFVQ